MDMELGRTENNTDVSQPSVADAPAVCGICAEYMQGSSMFDCGHAVCFTCTTGMLKARDADASYVMSCCFSMEGCTGQLAVLPNKLRLDSLLGNSDADGSKEWRRYISCAEDAFLRSVGMYPCTSTTCRAQDVIFVPDVKVAHHTQCGRCGEFICTLCTHMAGKCVPSHAPLPCARRVELQHCILTLKNLVQDSERAVRRESNNRRESQIRRDFHEGIQQMLHPTIEQQIVDAVGNGVRKTSCAEIFAAFKTVKSAIEATHNASSNGSSEGHAAGSEVTLANSSSAISSSPTMTKPVDLLSSGLYAGTLRSRREMVGRGNDPRYLPVHDISPPTDHIIAIDDSLRYAAPRAQDTSTPEVTLSILRFEATANWCRLFVAKHKLAISSPTLQQCIELLQRHHRTKEVAILNRIQAGTYKVLPSCRIMPFREF